MAAPLLYDATGTPVAGIDPDIAVQILPYGVDKGRWLATRRTGIGGSDVSPLVGLSKWTSRYELWEDKTGRLPLTDESPSEAATWGTLLEPVVREEFARRATLTVRTVGMLRSVQWPWMLANPDGLVSDGAGYEGKTCSPWQAHEWGTNEHPLVPDHAELQSQWCMAVTGLRHWWVAGLIGGQTLAVRLVERDDELIAELVRISEEFWNVNVIGGAEPDIDGSSACTDLLAERYPTSDEDSIADVDEETRDELVIAREKAVAGEKAAKADHDAVKNRVRKLLGPAERLMCGDQEIATWRNTGQFAEKRFLIENPDLAAQYMRTVEAFDVDAFKADHPELHATCRARVLRFKD